MLFALLAFAHAGCYLLATLAVHHPLTRTACLPCTATRADEPERTAWYSQTLFADLWRRATQQNPFYTTVCVNGGMVSALMLGAKLQEHRRALAAERAQANARKAQ